MSARLTTKEFIRRAQRVHGKRYDYSATKYVHNKFNVLIKCSTHGDFSQSPSGHMNGRGCRLCANEQRSNHRRIYPVKGFKTHSFVATGRWLLRRNARRNTNNMYHEFRCPHGRKRFLLHANVKHGLSKSCGHWGECFLERAYINSDGYIIVTVDHKQLSLHRYVMEKKLGRKLRQDETVHHKNGNRQDNRPRNLELWSKNHGAGARVVDLRKYLMTIPRSLGGLK